MEVNKGVFSGAHFNLITIDDVAETGTPLTEETFREWLQEALEVSNQQMANRGLANSGLRLTATEVLAREESKKLAHLLVSQQQGKKRASLLLRRLITPSQWKDYDSLGYFSQKDGKGRIWKFKKDHHYPIECDGQQICIDPELGAPDEDLLLQVWLEIIGGRAEEILSTAQEWIVQYLTIEVVYLDNHKAIDYPRHYGVLHGIT